jgi:hypothetical protein
MTLFLNPFELIFFNCLKQLLGVKFIYGKDDQEEQITKKSNIEFSRIQIPKVLYQKFINSIEVCNMTLLENNLQELGEINDHC